ncbi:MAG: type II secretion system major pseudopilin GspG [Azoarcus sp.]|jgi:general secretion pathway protein G|nr:type II secretion system major pseudopilin GspG [Azoarcus sp.]
MNANRFRFIARRALGFTLVEILVVIAIIGLLASLVGPKVMGQLGGAKTKATALQVKDLEQAAELFKLDVGRFPSSAEGLDALVNRPATATGWNGPYLRRGLPKDPWGNAYLYENPGKHGEIDIYSLGQDKAAGGEGESTDVGNWQ